MKHSFLALSLLVPGLALAQGYPLPREMREVSQLANQAAVITQNIERQADRFGDYRDRYARDAVRRLREAAFQFSYEVQQNLHSPARTEFSYRNLVSLQRQFDQSCHSLNADAVPAFQAKKARLQNTLSQLAVYYQFQRAPRNPRQPHQPRQPGQPGHQPRQPRQPGHQPGQPPRTPQPRQPGHQPPVAQPIYADLYAEVGGNFKDKTIRLRGVIYGADLRKAHVYVGNRLVQSLDLNSASQANTFYSRVKTNRFGGSELIQVRVTCNRGVSTTVYSQFH